MVWSKETLAVKKCFQSSCMNTCFFWLSKNSQGCPHSSSLYSQFLVMWYAAGWWPSLVQGQLLSNLQNWSAASSYVLRDRDVYVEHFVFWLQASSLWCFSEGCKIKECTSYLNCGVLQIFWQSTLLHLYCTRSECYCSWLAITTSYRLIAWHNICMCGVSLHTYIYYVSHKDREKNCTEATF